jgi:membrane associated rhomboid family serine protease
MTTFLRLAWQYILLFGSLAAGWRLLLLIGSPSFQSSAELVGVIAGVVLLALPPYVLWRRRIKNDKPSR